MKRGLVIGRFCPFHLGHHALIRFATLHCDELIVLMSHKPDDAIDAVVRFSWIADTFRGQDNIKPEMVLDDFDDGTLSLPERTRIRAAFIKERFPGIDLLFSSEEHGDLLAQELGVVHIAFDRERVQVPVSSTLILEKPFAFWDYIPDVVRPFFVRKICFFGPESTGKTMLAKHLAEVYHTEYVPEVAREMITANDFTLEDIIRMGHAQTQRVLEKTRTANKILFCDTDLITTAIYSQHYLHRVPPALRELEELVKYDLYFLFDIDVPWVPDGLRDLGHRREAMHKTFKSALVERGISGVEVSGNFEERERRVRKRIDRLMKDLS